MENENLYPFKKAYLADRNGDMTKKWYIKFYAFDVQKNKIWPKWDYSINDYKTPVERKAYAKIRIKQINDLLKQGYHFNAEKSEKNIERSIGKNMSISEALEYALRLKKNSDATYNSYKSEIDLFCKFLGEKSKHNINAITRKEVYSYIDYRNSIGNAGKTINSKLGYLSSMFGRLKKRDVIKENVFSEVEKEKEVKSYRNLAYNSSDTSLLSELIQKKDKELWRFINVIYYTFMRPNEIRQLQVYNILLSKKQIYIDAFKSKNKGNIS